MIKTTSTGLSVSVKGIAPNELDSVLDLLKTYLVDIKCIHLTFNPHPDCSRGGV